MTKGSSRADSQWVRIVDAIVRGERQRLPLVRIGPTPDLLRRFGLAPSDLMMSAAKVARVRREHPEVMLDVWHRLPALLDRPIAVFPSARRDGSMIVVLVAVDVNGDPIIVPIAPGVDDAPNIVLSVYGKEAGIEAVRTELERARVDDLLIYESKDFTAALPQPRSASEDTILSSPGPIPVDGAVKPVRELLRPRSSVKKDD